LRSSTSHRASPSRLTGCETSARTQLVRRPLEGGPLLHHERGGNLQIGERLSSGGQRVALRLEERRRRSEHGGQVVRLRLTAVGTCERQHGPKARREVGAQKRIRGGRRRQSETSDALANRPVTLMDAHVDSRALREAEWHLGREDGLAREALRVPHRVDRPRSSSAILYSFARRQ
jgi:hypothetical protein